MKKDAEWVTGVTPKEGEFSQKGRPGHWPPLLLAMKVGEWVKTPGRRMCAAECAAFRMKKEGKGEWTARGSKDGKWRWIQRVK